MAAVGDQFVAFFVAANSGDAGNPTSVFASSLERTGDTRPILRIEINPHPQAIHGQGGGKPIPLARSRKN
jgi:hypothetical protein